MKKLNNEQFIKLAKEVHGEKYRYDEVNYTTAMKKVSIVCPIHGNFMQRPNDHTSGKCGCPKCKSDKIGNIKRNTIEKVLKDFKTTHNETYDYSNMIFKSVNSKIDIICKEHGVFQQTPGKHIIGRGCPKCKYSNGEKIIMQILTDSNIKFETQKYFPDLYGHHRHLSYDFYLPDYNLLIEYDGEFHFCHTKVFNYKHITEEEAVEKFLKTIEYDCRKTIYAQNNSIHLLRISYKHYTYKRIKQIIDSYILYLK
jgi:hypothetical protein